MVNETLWMSHVMYLITSNHLKLFCSLHLLNHAHFKGDPDAWLICDWFKLPMLCTVHANTLGYLHFQLQVIPSVFELLLLHYSYQKCL